MNEDAAVSIARGIMLDFADATGLSAAERPPRRYLWTDAFAVCNFLGLARQAGDEGNRLLALRLVDQVHGILGRHRGDDPRHGWISGLLDREGAMHPTRGGLRIGKPMSERQPADPFDESLEWDRDGQYYHYLTKWMHALQCVSRATGELSYNRWAVELAKTAHARFTYRPPAGGRRRMYWKMSIDLSRPLVLSMGHHDPLDGLITFTELEEGARRDPERPAGLALDGELSELADMCRGMDWMTGDPLGIGGLLTDACRVGQLMARGRFEGGALLEDLVYAALGGLEAFLGADPFALPAGRRLAFRELGLSIGLRAAGRLTRFVEERPSLFGAGRRLGAGMKALLSHAGLSETVESFWLEPGNQDAGTWRDHRDINRVMLATSLAPNGFLSL